MPLYLQGAVQVSLSLQLGQSWQCYRSTPCCTQSLALSSENPAAGLLMLRDMDWGGCKPFASCPKGGQNLCYNISGEKSNWKIVIMSVRYSSIPVHEDIAKWRCILSHDCYLHTKAEISPYILLPHLHSKLHMCSYPSNTRGWDSSRGAVRVTTNIPLIFFQRQAVTLKIKVSTVTCSLGFHSHLTVDQNCWSFFKPLAFVELRFPAKPT